MRGRSSEETFKVTAMHKKALELLNEAGIEAYIGERTYNKSVHNEIIELRKSTKVITKK